jgi:hypothetical protein
MEHPGQLVVPDIFLVVQEVMEIAIKEVALMVVEAKEEDLLLRQQEQLEQLIQAAVEGQELQQLQEPMAVQVL